MPTVSAFSSTAALASNDAELVSESSFSTGFTSLGVPDGSIINGFKFTLRASKRLEDHTFNADGPLLFKIQKGSGDSATLSSAVGLNETLSSFGGEEFQDVTVGSSSQLFGLTWDSTTANAVQFVYNQSFSADLPEGFSLFVNSVQCEITYTAGGNGLIKHTSGFLKLKTGKITL